MEARYGQKAIRDKEADYFCVAVLIFLSPLACSLSKTMSTKMVDVSGDEARANLVLGKTYLARGEYGSALKENEKVISLAGKDVPAGPSPFLYRPDLCPSCQFGKGLWKIHDFIQEADKRLSRESSG